jgi:hypothetical protein
MCKKKEKEESIVVGHDIPLVVKIAGMSFFVRDFFNPAPSPITIFVGLVWLAFGHGIEIVCVALIVVNAHDFEEGKGSVVARGKLSDARLQGADLLFQLGNLVTSSRDFLHGVITTTLDEFTRFLCHQTSAAIEARNEEFHLAVIN